MCMHTPWSRGTCTSPGKKMYSTCAPKWIGGEIPLHAHPSQVEMHVHRKCSHSIRMHPPMYSLDMRRLIVSWCAMWIVQFDKAQYVHSACLKEHMCSLSTATHCPQNNVAKRLEAVLRNKNNENHQFKSRTCSQKRHTTTATRNKNNESHQKQNTTSRKFAENAIFSYKKKIKIAKKKKKKKKGQFTKITPIKLRQLQHQILIFDKIICCNEILLLLCVGYFVFKTKQKLRTQT